MPIATLFCLVASNVVLQVLQAKVEQEHDFAAATHVG